jgi:hypothetical protein
MSVSLTTPSRRPSASTTGTPEIPRESRSSATSFSGSEGRTFTTSVVITSATIIRNPLL